MGDMPMGAPAPAPTSSPNGPNSGQVQGANTFDSLKSLFKNVYSKKCKHCGQQFTPKGPKI